MKTDRNLLIILLLCFTLGLAPFKPEPHIWGKIKWIIGGAVNMKVMDWFDFVLHGSPWVALIYMVLKSSIRGKEKVE